MSSVNLAVTLVNPEMHGGEVPAGAFHGKTIPEAAKLYLSIVKKKQSTSEIVDGLRQGGMETSGKNFDSIVAAGLYRASKKFGEIVRVKGAWGLKEWWPAGVGAPSEKTKGRKAKKSRKQKSVKPVATAAIANVESNGHEKSQERVADLLRSNPTKIYTPVEVSQALNLDARGVGLTLGRLAASNRAEKLEPGKYRAAHG